MINIKSKSVKMTGKIKYQNDLKINQMNNSYRLLRIILKQTYNTERKRD